MPIKKRVWGIELAIRWADQIVILQPTSAENPGEVMHGVLMILLTTVFSGIENRIALYTMMNRRCVSKCTSQDKLPRC